MPNSLKARLGKLKYKGIISDKDYERLCKALDQQPIEDYISRQSVEEFVEYIQTIKDKHNDEGSPINYGTICDLVIRGWKLVEQR